MRQPRALARHDPGRTGPIELLLAGQHLPRDAELCAPPRPAPPFFAPPFFAPPFFAPPAATHRMLLQARPDQREGELPRGAHLLENADRWQPVGALRVAHEHCGLDRSGQRHRLQLRLPY